MTEGFQARGQSVAHGQCARMDNPAESVSVQGNGQRDDGRGEEGLAGGGNPGAAETASSPFTTAVILGYGVNIAQAPGTLPTPQATSLLAEGDVQAGADPTAVAHEVLAVILAGLDERIRSLVAHGDAASAGLAAEAEAALPLIGTRIVLASPTDAFGTPALEGVALGLAPTGALLVRDDDGQTHQIDAGDVLATGTPLTPVHDTKEKRANN